MRHEGNTGGQGGLDWGDHSDRNVDQNQPSHTPERRTPGLQIGATANHAETSAASEPWWFTQDPAVAKRPTPIVDFVLTHVANVEDLHAETLEAGEEKYKGALANTLRKTTLKEPFARGGLFEVHEVEGNDQVVVKILRAIESRDALDRFKAHHEQLAELFGPDHMPDTEFLRFDTAGIDDPDSYFVEDATESVMVQEKLTGIQYLNPAYDSRADLEAATQTISDAMRAQVDSFAEKYRRAQKEAMILPEEQIMFDFENNTVKLVDTNYPHTFRTALDEAYTSEVLDVDPATIRTPQQLADALIATSDNPDALRGRPWSEVRDIFVNDVNLEGEEELLETLEYFPPEGDNKFIKDLTSIGLVPPQEE